MKNSLFIQQAYLNGEFISSENTFEIINPSTNKSIGTLPNLTVEDCKEHNKHIENVESCK